MRRLLWILALAGCNDDGTAASKAPAAPPRQLAGVYPEKWRCDSVASLDALGSVLGGVARPIESPSSIPRGVPHPCNYELTLANPPPPPQTGSGSAEPVDPHEYWTFDLDCRDGMKPRADALFAQYRETSKQLVEQYAIAQAAAAKAGPARPHHKGAKDDVTATVHPPEPAADVAVGAKGLDHHGQGLIFIDDDAPCYVRVVGKDAARRLALAQLLARNLTFANAPMTPRAAP
ncbi:MAG TPA: hypothetical protein VGC42_12225 [Kofleriaceae bacterium]